MINAKGDKDISWSDKKFLVIPRWGAPSYFKELCGVRKEMFESGLFTDVRFRVGPRTFHCHQSVLASVSPFLRELFRGERCCRERSGDLTVLMDGISDPSSFEKLLEFLYNGKVEKIVDASSVSDLVETMQVLGIKNLEMELLEPSSSSILISQVKTLEEEEEEEKEQEGVRRVFDSECIQCGTRGFSGMKELEDHLEACQSVLAPLRLTKVDSELFPATAGTTSSLSPLPIDKWKSSDENLSCEVCEEVFTERKLYLDHILFHFKEELLPPFEEGPKMKCPQCTKEFRKTDLLLKHVGLKHQMIRRFVSPKTSEVIFYDLPDSERVRHVCSECGKDFRTRVILERHFSYRHVKIINSRKDRTCHICEIECKTRKALEKHINYKHVQPQITLSEKTCSYCGKICPSKKKLNHHINFWHMRNKCFACDQAFATIHELDDHILNSHGEISYNERRAFLCRICDKQCFSGNSLERHLKTFHNSMENNGAVFIDVNGSGEGRFSATEKEEKSSSMCPYCSKCFESRDELEDHILQSHENNPIPENERTCKYCGKIFLNRRGIDQHVYFKHKQDNSKSLNARTCAYCSKSFKSPKIMQFHIKSRHLKARTQFPCPFCNANSSVYKTKSSFIFHLSVSHFKDRVVEHLKNEGATSFERCNFCYKVFEPNFYKRKNVRGILYHYANVHNILSYILRDPMEVKMFEEAFKTLPELPPPQFLKKPSESEPVEELESPYPCPFCGLDSLKDKKSVRTHIMCHAREKIGNMLALSTKLYELCQECNSEFRATEIIDHALNTHDWALKVLPTEVIDAFFNNQPKVSSLVSSTFPDISSEQDNPTERTDIV